MNDFKVRSFKKGSDFETSTLLTLNTRIKQKGLILHDVHVPYKQNAAQIDLLVVVGWTFYILELKNYDNSLSGTVSDDKWTALSGSRSYKVYNPLKQNRVQQFKLAYQLKSMGFKPPVKSKGLIIVPNTCRLEIQDHLRKSIITVEDFVRIANSTPQDVGDIVRLREVLSDWRK